MTTAEFEREVWLMGIDAMVDFAFSTENYRLFAAKSDALKENIGRCKKYHELGFASEIILTVLRKKLDLLRTAATVKDAEKLKSPSAPIYQRYSGGFKTDDTWVAEEELIQWALTSQRAPLPSDIRKRYFDLYQQIFGVNVWESAKA